MPSNSKHKQHRAVSVIGSISIALLLVIAVTYGITTFHVASSSAAGGGPSQVTVSGTATRTQGNGECGGGFVATGVIFQSSAGMNYTASFSNPNSYANGTYSVTVPNNDNYNIYLKWRHDCPSPNFESGECTPGSLSLQSGSAEVQYDFKCPFATTTTTATGSSSSTVSSTTTSTATTSPTTSTTVNTQISTTCKQP
jgi:hypothetical protein